MKRSNFRLLMDSIRYLKYVPNKMHILSQDSRECLLKHVKKKRLFILRNQLSALSATTRRRLTTVQDLRSNHAPSTRITAPEINSRSDYWSLIQLVPCVLLQPSCLFFRALENNKLMKRLLFCGGFAAGLANETSSLVRF